MDEQHTISIGKIVRNAIVFDFRNQQRELMNTDALLESIARLFTLLHDREIEYVLVGGVAMLQYVEGRNTEDIDLIMALSSLRQIPEMTIISQDNDFIRGRFHELQVDVLLTRHPLFDTVRRRYATIKPFTEREIPCATVEGLLLLKLYALPSLYRQGNFTRVGLYENDIATLLHDYQPDLAPLFDELVCHLSDSDITSLHDIIAEIQQRLDRFRQGFDESH